MGLRDAISGFFLERMLDAASNDQNPDFSASFHKLFAAGPDRFRSSLRSLVEKRGWESCKPLLRILIETPVGAWIPSELLPRFIFLDLERDPKSGAIKEFAIASTHPLEANPEIHELVAKHDGGLEKNQIEKLLGENGNGDWVVGHNIRNFDAVHLRELGISLPEESLLDTLELSLVLDPLNAGHALEGDHTARNDVRANISLFWSMDRRWLGLDADEIGRHQSWSDPTSGYGRYLQSVTTRRSCGTDDRASTGKKPPSFDVKEIMRRILAAQRDDQRNASLPDAGKTSSSSTPIGPLDAARYVARGLDEPVAVPDALLSSLRRHVRECTGLLRLAGTYAHFDQRVDASLITGRLGNGLEDIAASYMSRWLEQGGRLLAEVHPVARPWVEEEFERRAKGSPAPPSDAAVIDHTTWLRHGGPSVVLGAEFLEESAGKASGDHVRIDNMQDEAAKAALQLIQSRTLSLKALETERLTCVLSEEDKLDSLYDALSKALSLSGRPDHRHAANLLNVLGNGFAICLSCQVAEDNLKTLSVEYRKENSSQWLQRRMGELRPSARLVCGPVGSIGLRTRLGEILGTKVDAPKPGSAERGLLVAEDGSLGSLSGIGRSMMAAAAHLYDLTQKEPEHAAALLGISPDLQSVMVEALRAAGVAAHSELTFGGRRRTVERLGDEKAYVLVANSYPEPVPPHAKRVLVRRLPFPAKSDPEMQLALSALDEDQDPFQEIILPRLLRRLGLFIATLRDLGVEPLLIDKRPLVHTAYRRSIEEIFGPMRAVEAAPKIPSSARKLVVDRVAEGLESRGLRKGRGAFADVDPDPILRRMLGHSAQWREPQRDIVTQILRGEDSLVVMPTGAGKSMCYQVPGIVFGELDDELTVVISPLKALMRDQVTALKKKGIWGVSAYHSDLDQAERTRTLQEVRTGWTSLLYLAPEQLLNEIVRDALFERGVRLLVVDEAHCVSEWGHDFRPEYRKISDFLDELASIRGEERCQVAAFTATATVAIQRDICTALRIDSEPVNLGVRRTNIRPRIISLPNKSGVDDRIRRILDFLKDHRGEPGIIYATKRSTTEDLARRLKSSTPPGFSPSSIDYLHAGLSDRADRAARERRFLEPDGETLIIVATTAFGMGVDKPDIRWIVHADAPGSVEAYAQEIGRAARDVKLTADTLALVSHDDLNLRHRMAKSVDEYSVSEVLRYLRSGIRGENKNVAFLEPIAAATRLKEVEVSVSLFHLERIGILEVLGRLSGFYWVGVGPNANQAKDWREKKIVEYITQQKRPFHLAVPDLRTELFPGDGTTIEECDRIVRSMLKDKLLERVTSIEIGALGNSTDRTERLSRWSFGEAHLALSLDQRVENVSGKWVLLTPRDQFELLQSAGMKLEHFDQVVAEWRARGLISIHRDTFNLSLTPKRTKSIAQSVTSLCAEREHALEGLERHWNEAGSDVCELSESQVDGNFAQLMSDLSARGVLNLNDRSRIKQGYKLRWVASADRDEALLDHLNLAERERSKDYRMSQLGMLFGADKGTEETWDFIEDYFASDDQISASPKLQRTLTDGLTEQQADAVKAPADVPLLINAGAGTGKTHVLARRILRLQAEEHIDASRMLVLSFSRSGAGAIGERVGKLARELDLQTVRVGTFHSLCYHMIYLLGRRPTLVNKSRLPASLQGKNHYLNGLAYNSVLVDLFSDGFEDVPMTGRGGNGAGQTISDYGKMLDTIRSGHPELPHVIVKPEDLNRDDLPDELALRDGEGSLPTRSVHVVYAAYERELRNQGLIDFAEMVAFCLDNLRNNPRFRRRMRSRLSHLLVDEFQDTSRAQEEVMRHLVGSSSGLTVVGDNDQTIFSFSGSDVDNILCFADRNASTGVGEETRVTPLEENFRSTQKILSVASRLIELNEERIEKTIRPAAVQLAEPRESYRQKNTSVRLVDTGDASLAVQFACEQIEAWLNEGVLPHEIAVLSRLNPKSSPNRALLDQLEAKLRHEKIAVATEIDAAISPKRLISRIAPLAKNEPDLPIHGALENHSEVVSAWSDGINRELLKVLIEDARNRGISTFEEWREDLEAASTNPQESNHLRTHGINLKTIHRAKGEEYRRVIVLHLEHGVFPPKQAKDTEEERRLLYVAITRAEDEVVITGSAQSQRNRFWQDMVRIGGEDIAVENYVSDDSRSAGAEYSVSGRTVDGVNEATEGLDHESWQQRLDEISSSQKGPAQDSNNASGQRLDRTNLGRQFDDLMD